MRNTATMVLKICERKAWALARAEGWFTGSADDARDGFIHLSAPHQIAGTLARHFAGQADLVLVAYAASRLGAALKWETSRDGALFPHHYGPLPVAQALWVEPILLDGEGVAVLPFAPGPPLEIET